MSAEFEQILRALLVERQRRVPPPPRVPDDFRHPSDTDEACARRRQVLVEAMAGFRVRPYRTYRQRTPQEIATRRAAA